MQPPSAARISNPARPNLFLCSLSRRAGVCLCASASLRLFSRPNPLQIQPLRRRSRPANATISSSQHSRNIIRRVSPNPNLYERAHHDPHHVPEKTRPFDADDNSRTTGCNRAIRDAANAMLATMRWPREAGEIVLPDKMNRSSFHRGNIQRLPPMPGKIERKWITVQRVPDVILISLRYSRGDRIK